MNFFMAPWYWQGKAASYLRPFKLTYKEKNKGFLCSTSLNFLASAERQSSDLSSRPNMNLSAKRMRLRTNTSRLGRTSDWSLDFCSNSNFSEVKKSKCLKRELIMCVCPLPLCVSTIRGDAASTLSSALVRNQEPLPTVQYQLVTSQYQMGSINIFKPLCTLL